MNHHGAVAGDPGVWLLPTTVAVVLVGAYVAAAAGVRTRTGRPWRRGRTVSLVVGAALLALGLSPAVDHVAGGAAQAHMLRHVLLGMVAPLALVLAAPVTLLLASLRVPRRGAAVRLLGSRPVRALTHPVTAGVLHVGPLFVLYGTPLYPLSLHDDVVHGLVLAHFVAAGCLYAWALVGPERAARGPGLGLRVAVLVAASAAHGYLAKTLYARAADLPAGAVHGVADLQDAARWMYYAGDVAEVALAVALFASWYERTARRARSARPAVVPPGADAVAAG